VLILAGAVPVPVVLREKREVVLLNLMFQPGSCLLCLIPRDISQPLWYGSIPHNFRQLSGVAKWKFYPKVASYDEYRRRPACPAFSVLPHHHGSGRDIARHHIRRAG